MNSALQSWIDDLPEFPGLLAAYVLPAQEEPRIRSWSEKCTIEGVQSLHRQVGDVVEVLDAGQIPARKLRWIFGSTVVYFERRKDGAGMCLITSQDPWVGEGDIITQLITDFRSAV